MIDHSIFKKVLLYDCVTHRRVQQKHHWLSCIWVGCCEFLIDWILSLEMHLDKASIRLTTITTAVISLKPIPS